MLERVVVGWPGGRKQPIASRGNWSNARAESRPAPGGIVKKLMKGFGANAAKLSPQIRASLSQSKMINTYTDFKR